MSAASLSTPDFASMTRAEMLDYAVENGVEGVNSSMKKADILAVLRRTVS